MDRRTLARAVFDTAHLTGTFTLRSGAVSDEYFDKYLFEAEPTLLAAIARELASLLPHDVEVLAGLETGGIPLAVLLSQRTGLPTRFVRKEAKPYGTRQLAEGGPVKGLRLVIVEDVVTSGGQVSASARALREGGADVDHAVCVIDRGATGRPALAQEGIALHALFTMEELREAAVH